MNILALDLATVTGYALGSDSVVESGTATFDVKRGESPGMRYVKFTRWIAEALDIHKPALVVYEQAHHRGGAATEVLAGLVTRVLEACAERNLLHAPIHSQTLKKFATGSGRSDKAQMLVCAMQRWPDKKFADDNECDAWWLWQYAHDRIAPKAFVSEVH